MAKQTINIGTTANDGTGDTIRDAFDKVNDNFDELYTDDAGDVNSVTAGNGLTGTATTGAITINAVGGDGITANADEIEVAVDDSTVELSASDGSGTVRVKDGGITNAKLADDAVDHDELAARYTAKQDISTTTGTINLDASSYAIFELTGNLATATLNIQNMKKGTIMDILLSGSDLSSAVITLSDDFTTSAINKVGTTDLDTSATNLIQVICIDDNDSDAILNYSINTYTSDTTP